MASDDDDRQPWDRKQSSTTSDTSGSVVVIVYVGGDTTTGTGFGWRDVPPNRADVEHWDTMECPEENVEWSERELPHWPRPQSTRTRPPRYGTRVPRHRFVNSAFAGKRREPP